MTLGVTLYILKRISIYCFGFSLVSLVKIFGEIEIMKIRMGRDQSRVLESWLWASFYRKSLIQSKQESLVFSGSAQLRTA